MTNQVKGSTSWPYFCTPAAGAELLHDQRDDRGRADRQREQIRIGLAEHAGDEPVAERAVLRGNVADVRVAEHDEREPAEDEHAGEGHDERGDADKGDPESLPCADERADEQREHHRRATRAGPS